MITLFVFHYNYFTRKKGERFQTTGCLKIDATHLYDNDLLLW